MYKSIVGIVWTGSLSSFFGIHILYTILKNKVILVTKALHFIIQFVRTFNDKYDFFNCKLISFCENPD